MSTGVGPEAVLRNLQARGTNAAEALAFLDGLPAVTVEEMIGAWSGSGLRTGHPFDGLLEAYGWRGKRFDGPDDAYPLVFEDSRGAFSVDPAGLPVSLLIRFGAALGRGVLPAAVRPLLPLRRTTRPTARLRMIDYRGVSTATMTYDALPINDHVRKVDDDTLLGVMDLRGLPEPFFFVLRREGRDG